jgi:succinoglycan biosynthesis transport protein ExoP
MRVAQDAASPETSFADVVEIMIRRRKIVVIVLLLTMALGAILATRPRTYAASGTIRIQPGNAGEYRTNTAPTNALPEDKIASDVAILRSHSVEMRVAKELDLANEPAIWKDAKSKHRDLDDPKTRQRLSNWFKDAIKVYHTPKDEIIGITCTTTVPSLSSRIVNAMINDYVAYLFEMRLTSTKRTSSWLVGQLDDLKSVIANDQVELVALQGKLGVIGFDPHNNEFLATQSLDSFTKAASAATIDRIVAESKYRYLEESDPNLIEGEVNVLSQETSAGDSNGLLEKLRSSRAEAAAGYANLNARFGSKYPEVKQAKAQLDELDREVKAEQSRIKNQAKLAFKAAVSNENKTNAEVREQKHEVFRSHGEMTRYLTLLSDYSSHKTLYEGLIQRLREAAITSGLEAGEVDIVDLADTPALPVPPGPITFLITSILAGFVLGCLAALVAEALDLRVYTAEQTERIANLPVLAEAPHDVWFRGLETKRLRGTATEMSPRVLNAPRSPYAEALQVLRTTLASPKTGQLPRLLLVTSALPGEGKTASAVNLAAVAALHGQRVLLVDCNFHRPGVDASAALIPSSTPSVAGGLTEVLAGYISLEEALWRPSGLYNLEVLFAGSQPPSPSVLLGSDAMQRLLAICRNNFDFVVLDSSPVLGYADALILGAWADAALLVVRSEKSGKSATRRVAKLLAGANVPVAGILLNDSRPMRTERSEPKPPQSLGKKTHAAIMRRFTTAALLVMFAIGSSRAQYAGPSGAGFDLPRTLINRTFLNDLLQTKRPELLFHTDDVLEIEAYGVPNFKFQQRVAQDGTITAPLLGKVQVSGLTIEETEAKISHLLVESQMINDANLTVNAVSRPSAVVTVNGAVAKPGVFPVTGDLTLSKALSLAGGLNGTSGVSTGPPASSTVTLVRPTLAEPVNIPLGPDSTSSPYGRIPLFPGDEIRVGKLGTIYTIGAFHTQGPIALKDTSATTVLNVISIAGGVGFQAKENKAYIIRVKQGQKVVIPVQLQDILKGKAEDIAMQDQDILMLPTNQMKAAIKGGGAALIVSVASAFIYSGTI